TPGPSPPPPATWSRKARPGGCRPSDRTSRASNSRGPSDADHHDETGRSELAADEEQHRPRGFGCRLPVPPAGRPDSHAVEERPGVRGGVVAVARGAVQRVRELGFVGEPRYAGRAEGASRRGW